MKKTSKYVMGAIFYVASIKEYVMVVTPVMAGTVVGVSPTTNLDLVLRYNIRTNKLIK